MAKTLYLHIGTYKTGTTSVQEYFFSHTDFFAEHGIAYPIPPYRYVQKNGTKKPWSRNACFISWPVWDEEGNRDLALENQQFHDCMDQLHDLFRTYDTVVLSDEALCKRMYEIKGTLERVAQDSKENDYTLKLIIYLRRQDQFIESRWNQAIKVTLEHRMTIEDYIDYYSDYLDYYELLDYYASVVGDENIIVRRYTDAARTGILQDFLQIIGMDPSGIPEENPVTNTGLYGNTVRLKTLINQVQSLTNAEQKFFGRSLLLCSDVSKQYYPCSEFSEEERREFMSRYEGKNALLADRFIGDGVPLFSDDYSGPPKREDMNPELINDVVRSAAAADLLLYRENLELSQRVRKLEKQVASLERRMDHIRHPLNAVASKIKRQISR
ncbi:MAG: hypothetical protein IJI20_00345 [Firmicutes bacterium]|nr:hypothetical protein [Bacillota bacterium]